MRCHRPEAQELGDDRALCEPRRQPRKDAERSSVGARAAQLFDFWLARPDASSVFPQPLHASRGRLFIL